MNRELTRVTGVVLIAFLVIGFGAAFWSVIQAKSLLARDDNARNVIEQQRIQRGAIVDRNGQRLAYTVDNEDGTARRVYPYPEAAGAVECIRSAIADAQPIFADILSEDLAQFVGVPRAGERGLELGL